jgi:hypothetical protein
VPIFIDFKLVTVHRVKHLRQARPLILHEVLRDFLISTSRIVFHELDYRPPFRQA